MFKSTIKLNCFKLKKRQCKSRLRTQHAQSVRFLNGFTLIELLVVISIIALLLSILMPSLQKVKEQARKVVCSANLRSICLGIVLYATDFGDKTPPGGDNYGIMLMQTQDMVLVPGVGTYASGTGKAEEIGIGFIYENYLSSSGKSLYCASYKDPLGVIGFDNDWGISHWDEVKNMEWEFPITSNYPYRGSYGWNQVNGPLSGGESRSLSVAKDRSRAIVADYFWPSPFFSDPYSNKRLAHKDGFNVGFLDTSVVFVRDPDRGGLRSIWGTPSSGYFWAWRQIEYTWLMFDDKEGIPLPPLSGGVKPWEQ